MMSVTVEWDDSSDVLAASSLAPFAEWITVENNTGVVLYVRTDGQAADVSGDCQTVEPGTAGLFANRQPLPNAMATPNQDLTDDEGWNSQQGYVSTALYPVGPNYISMAPELACTGSATVTFS